MLWREGQGPEGPCPPSMKNPPYPPFVKGGKLGQALWQTIEPKLLKSPYEKGGFRGI